MASSQLKIKLEEHRKFAMEASRSDWKDPNRKTKGGGLVLCPSCQSDDTDYSEFQTRGADEPMTVFGVIDNFQLLYF